jgi:hypothetical protein
MATLVRSVAWLITWHAEQAAIALVVKILACGLFLNMSTTSA